MRILEPVSTPGGILICRRSTLPSRWVSLNARRSAAQGVLEGNFQGLLNVLPALRHRPGAPAAAAREQIVKNGAESLGKAPP